MRAHPTGSDAAIVHEITRPAHYEIRVPDVLGQTLRTAFQGLQVQAEAGQTVLEWSLA